jgi:hypothetical protein
MAMSVHYGPAKRKPAKIQNEAQQRLVVHRGEAFTDREQVDIFAREAVHRQPHANTANTSKRNMPRIPQTTAIAAFVICCLLSID